MRSASPKPRVIASATERLAGKDFAELSPAELLMLSGLMRKLTLAEISLLGTYTYSTADLRATVAALAEGLGLLATILGSASTSMIFALTRSPCETTLARRGPSLPAPAPSL